MTTKKELEDAVVQAQILERLNYTTELIKLHMDQEQNDIQKLEVRINDLNEKIEELNETKIPSILVEISSLKVKSSLWGGLSGLIISIVTVIFLILQGC